MGELIRRNGITVLLFVAAIGFIIAGIITKEPFDVLQKSVHICLECIGVG